MSLATKLKHIPRKTVFQDNLARKTRMNATSVIVILSII